MKKHSRAINFLASALIAAAPVVPVAYAAPVSTQTLLSKLQWRSVGPYIGGRVVAVAGVPDEPNLFYMGAVDGGVWKSTNYGLSWENISDGWPSASDSIGALAVAPSNDKIIYAGTGESDIRSDMITGDGVYRSDDAGKTWTYAGLRDTRTISDLAIDPKHPDTVYASSLGHVFVAGPHRGVFKTTDGGKTWKKILFVNDKTGIVDLSMDPKDPQVLYAAAWQAQRTPWKLTSGGPGSGLYKTTDGGAHWTNISDHAGLPHSLLGKIGVAVAPSNPDVVYTIIQAREGGVFRSDDGGKTFKRVNDEMKLRQRAFYYMKIFVDPKDPNTVYMPQVDTLYVSHDGGKTFEETRTIPHGDHHVVWVNPNNTDILLEGNDGGATVSTDGGKSWSSIDNQPTGQFYHVNLDDQFPFHIYGAQQDEGSFEGPSATANGGIPLSSWQAVAFGESTWVVPQPGNPNITYGSGYYSIFVKYNLATEQYQSVSPWPDYKDGAASNELLFRFAWTHPILFSPVNPKQLLVGAQYVMTSDDYGRTWNTISPDLTRNDVRTEAPSGGPIDLDQSGAEIYPWISALAVSPLDSKLIWAGSSDGLVHVTTDGGKHWQAVRPPELPKWSHISAIQPSHTTKGTAYLAARRYMYDDYKPYVYKTTDYGRHWSAMTDGLPADEYVFDIKQDLNDPNLLLLGAKNTIYASFDGGSRWQPLTLNLPHAQVRGIAFNARQGDVVVATHGRAFWVLDNLKLLEQMTRHPQVDAGAPALFAPETAWLTASYGSYSYGSDGNSGENPPFGATVFFHVPKSYDGKTPVKLEFTDAGGKLVRSFNLHLKPAKARHEKKNNEELTPAQRRAKAMRKHTAIEPGMNKFQWDLHYPDAIAVKNFYPPEPAGGLEASVKGPEAMPGIYHVVLDYGGHKTRQSFRIALDPRLDTREADLKARFDLQQQVQDALNELDRDINNALAARDQLEAAIDRNGTGNAQANQALAALNEAIDNVVQLHIHSSEGDLLYEAKLHSRLEYLGTGVGMARVAPTRAQYAVFKELKREARAGEEKLAAAVAQAQAVAGG